MLILWSCKNQDKNILTKIKLKGYIQTIKLVQKSKLEAMEGLNRR